MHLFLGIAMLAYIYIYIYIYILRNIVLFAELFPKKCLFRDIAFINASFKNQSVSADLVKNVIYFKCKIVF